MIEEFIPYEEALALKELGFNEKCLSSYYYKTPEFKWVLHPVISNNEIFGIIAAPIWSQAFRWFRDNHSLFGGPIHICGESRYYIEDKNKNYHNDLHFSEPREAEIACLKELIKIIKEKK